MYSYSAGSPGTFSGPRPIDVKGPGYGLAPRAEGGVVPSQRGWRNVGKQFRLPPGYSTYLQEGRPLSYAPRFGAAEGTGSGQDTGGGWADVINASIAGVASIFQISTQMKLQKQAQHQAERERAAQLELARTQALYLQSQSIKPAQGSHVTVATAAPAGGGMGRTAMLVGGVAVVGGLAWMMMGRGRRRRR